MKAIVTPFNATDKVPLHEVVPLDTPFVMSIEPSSICNLKCTFCTLSKSNEKGIIMPNEVFDKIIHDLKDFKQPLKLVYFSMIGEPLLNKRLPEMVRRLYLERLTNETVLNTNAVSLTDDIALRLVDAGLTRIRISVNGLSSEDYLRNCGVKIDFDTFVKQIAFLYKNKKNLIIQIKTVDKLLRPGGETRFYEIFGDICDQISIEQLFPIFENVNYGKFFTQHESIPAGRYASVQSNVKICALPFYRTVVRANGDVNLCYSYIPDGNILDKSLKEVWYGEKRKKLLTNLLKMKFDGVARNCDGCVCGHEQAGPKDNLYPYRNSILKRL